MSEAFDGDCSLGSFVTAQTSTDEHVPRSQRDLCLSTAPAEVNGGFGFPVLYTVSPTVGWWTTKPAEMVVEPIWEALSITLEGVKTFECLHF